MKNKRGFTLVELMAVLIILILVMLIAISRVRQTRKEAQLKTIEANALKYVRAIDDKASTSNLEDKLYKKGYFTKNYLSNHGINLSGTVPDEAMICIEDYKVKNACLEYSGSRVIYEDNKVKNIKKGTCAGITFDCNLDTIAEFEYNGSYDTFVAPATSIYKIELWGAQGQNYNDSNVGGKGAYTSGLIELNAGDVLYFYVGQKGANKAASYNGGANAGSSTDGTYTSGGGATDVRLVDGTWSDFNSLKSRIMVAAGGAGTGYYTAVIKGGAGGALSGIKGTQAGSGSSHTVATGGSQTSPGLSINGGNSNSGFGYAGQPNTYGTGGGGGYYGGGSGHATSSKVSAGAGGSSFISGYTGCDAISEESTSDNIVHTGQPVHYSNKKFSFSIMKAGNEEMPTHDGTSTMIGNEGNGYAKISGYVSSDAALYEPNTYSFTGSIQTFTAPKNGTYKLEVWGAQGGSIDDNNLGGYGGYSVGNVSLTAGQKIYIAVGSSGDATNPGYNGGGEALTSTDVYYAVGGGATHIATTDGLLSSKSSSISDILIVAGGGGGTSKYVNTYVPAGSGGGYIGGSPYYTRWNSGTTNLSNETGGKQESETGGGLDSLGGGCGAVVDDYTYGSFGLAAPGSGGGYYGGSHFGGCDNVYSGSGGSGYIGNTLLTNKKMYCYNCLENADADTNTIKTTCVDTEAKVNCAKQGNGAARITLIP